ncbi:MAG TPA: hypothetical protein VJ698_13460 [Noviherbaspirillum sp.]|uniref:hypothetical protein n=1 Tax=Noviherbaspirillum sp. TaxID=1926288 RepID=UPI002B4717CC|nr:hypothetical protein [Noviherbaspirillum sp.]HJV86475.1 hypothetical protein [Noviherbaspirillum sp.]
MPSPDTPVHNEESGSASYPSPALLAGSGDAQPKPVDQEPALPMIIPQRLPALQIEPHTAQAAHESARKFPAIVQAILISACLTVALIAVVGLFKSNRVATQVARADADAAVVVPASPAAGGTSETAATKNVTKVRPAHEKARTAASAHRPTETKTAHARSERAMHAVAASPRKKAASTLAKASNKPHEERSSTLLAQNSAALPIKTSGAQDEYAQCEQQSSFFRREQCKWRVCGGKWGQDGCPSYTNDNREFN